ncbi:prolyl oligopeptidase family serine peptidase [Sphingomonas sp. NSE70-1]|uniref:Prolyl oligopeptidase family serine peptidase n=1 Tax=Sphingomonas caseinilyticus TaxID=2908205 RepID=A0ABT0RTF0_9SPHN|nr:acyl-CoA thioester hydrolase/BAAT C-terminal domain-containing protein [Sphingomonas caseinilyticus]MCL6698226.1 prolyl oligopeptidase family serine peptidase [Sphingomonas caseinilyticus]
MKRGWKIALGVVGAVVLIGAGGGAWMASLPPKPAKLVEAGPTGQRIDAAGVLGNYFPAAGEGPHPAVLLLGGSEGGLSQGAQAQALLLQAEGFSTLQLAYHNAPGKSAKLVNIPLEDFYRALDWLKKQPGVDAGRIAIVGYSKGAEAGLLVATRYPGIGAAVLGMPSSVVWDGMSAENYVLGSFSSSWSEKGEPVAHLAYKGQPGSEGLMPVFVNGLKELDSNPDAAIPVEKYNGPLMLICGEAEKLWPSCPMTDQIVERAKAKGAPQPVVLRYKDAGHGVAGAPRSAASKDAWVSKLGGTEEGNWVARADSWPKVVAFLKAKLGGPE